MIFRLTRHAVIALTGLTLALTSATSSSQQFPTRPVVLVTPYQAGGSIDAIARPLAAKLAKIWGQPVVVENRPGANGMIATQSVVKAPPDGQTLLYHITGIIQNPLLYKKVGYDPIKDVVPIIQLGGQAMGLAVPVRSPIKTTAELVADGKGKGSQGHAYGTVGVGHTGHIWSELLAGEQGFTATHAPYKGSGPLVIDLVSDRLDWAFLSSAEAIVRATDKSVRVLAVTGTQRIPQLPDVSTLREQGYPGFEMVGWHGLFAPAGTPRAVIDRIEQDVRTVLADPEIQKILTAQVILGTGLGAEEFARVMRQDQARWATLIKRFNIQAD